MKDNIFEDAILTMAEKTPAEGDYKGEDGLIYCGRCRTAKQFRMNSIRNRAEETIYHMFIHS